MASYDGHLFPVDDYTPHGYLHTPKHTFLHPSGVLRSVEPLGLGWFKSGLPWYGFSKLTNYNAYLMLLTPAVRVNGTLFEEKADFEAAGTQLVSRYHSSQLMTYNFTFDGVDVEIGYFTGGEDTLYLKAIIANNGAVEARVVLDCALVYGMTGAQWWGSDAVMAKVRDKGIVSKILACGDVAALTSAPEADDAFVARGLDQLHALRQGGKTEDVNVSVPLPDPVCGALCFDKTIAPGKAETILCVLCRGKSENPVWAAAAAALAQADSVLDTKLQADDAFYEGAPALDGDFPDTWKRGFVYDFETLRMNIADPTGIYKHRWDTMQALSPRVVLAETAIDMMSMQYASPDTAREIFEGIFTDAPDVFVPCTREDGSMNMIGMDGTECATAPLWGSPMFVLRQVYAHTGDKAWLERMYPLLKAWLIWFRENRTDKEGWYHCNNSWESGQDGSVRFTAGMTAKDGPVEAANAEFVRTADLEAAMAYAEYTMAEFAEVLDKSDDVAYWRALADTGRDRVRSMFVDGWFRDFDSRSGKPFLNMGYYDPMLAMPFALGFGTEDQKAAADGVFRHFRENMIDPSIRSGYALMWPPLLMTYTEACAQSGRQRQGAEAVTIFADSAYGRDDSRTVAKMPHPMEGVPDKWNVIVPGTAMETLAGDPLKAGTENYGWGALLPALIIRLIFGVSVSLEGALTVRPALPDNLKGEHFVIKNLRLRGQIMTIALRRTGAGCTDVTVTFAEGREVTKSLEAGEALEINLV